ncbi:AfsR/SARP family transcriptional regulator, partial [Actinocorallia lasiicapitis]
MVTIRLLGAPRAEGAAKQPRGRKAWAVLAYLLLTERPPGRARLAELFFGDADDPLGALRWTLAELRRSVGVEISGDPVAVAVPGQVDVLEVCGGLTDPAPLLTADGELLEGVRLDSCLEFESWLVVERSRVSALIEARLRQAAATMLALGRPADAVEYAGRAVDRGPLEESNHELLVRCLTASGDRKAAARQVGICTDLFRRELGVEPSEALREAAGSAPGSAVAMPFAGRAAAVSQLEAGRAAIV